MTARIFILGAPRNIFCGLRPELSERMVYLSDDMRFPKGILKQVTRRMLVGHVPLKVNMLRWWFPKEDFDKLITATGEDTVLLYEWTNARVLKAILSHFPKGSEKNWHIYYCNPLEAIFKNPTNDLAKLTKLGIKLWSFDKVDARRFGIGMAGQFFRYVKVETHEAGNDCFFCGLPKDRANELELLRRILQKHGCSCDFVIPKSKEERISYDEYLDRLSRSRCVVDLCQKMQTGLTRRPIEAIFYNKKLITNNILIKEYDFYNPENVFIFGADKTDKLGEFVKKAAVPVADEIKEKYDVNGWLLQFLC